jgi:hypothetical protein
VATIATRSALATPARVSASASRFTRELVSAKVCEDPSPKTKQGRSGKRSAESLRNEPARVIGRTGSLPGRCGAGRHGGPNGRKVDVRIKYY